MALKSTHVEGGYIDGGQALYASAADYVAGMAAKQTANGVDVALTPATTNGLFKNDKSVDHGPKASPMVGDTSDTANLRATVLKGTVQVEMSAGTLLSGVVAAPWVWPGSAGAWAAGQKMYVNGAGKWDNQATVAGDQVMGYVLIPPTGATEGVLVADMWPFFSNNDAS